MGDSAAKHAAGTVHGTRYTAHKRVVLMYAFGCVWFVTGLFIGSNGRRYERFTALPKITSRLLKVKINVTDWRKIIATAAASLPADQVEIMNLSDTHSAITVKRYYDKVAIKENASKAVAIPNRCTIV